MDFLRDEDNYFPRYGQLNIKGELFTCNQPLAISILNCTPDSFYAESRTLESGNWKSTIDEAVRIGSQWIDVGGYSTRPGAADVSIEEEIRRVIPVIHSISRQYPNVIISIDTFRSEVARAAILEGAHVVNDISGGMNDQNMFAVVAELDVPIILMHSKGTPQTMQSLTEYESVFSEVAHFFSVQISTARKAGVKDIIIDPGFGFAKSTEGNFELMSRLAQFKIFNCPILVGVSRKSMISKTLGIHSDQALNGTTSLHAIALERGAAFIRVHDQQEAMEVIELFEKSRKIEQK